MFVAKSCEDMILSSVRSGILSVADKWAHNFE